MFVEFSTVHWNAEELWMVSRQSIDEENDGVKLEVRGNKIVGLN